MADDFATGGFGFEQLPKEALESQAQREDPLPAIETLVLCREECGGQQIAQMVLKLAQGCLAEVMGGPAAQRRQAGAERREIGRFPGWTP